MSSVDPRKLESIFLVLAAMDETERAASLERICDGDADLQREVQSLLRFHDQSAGGALDQSPLIHLTAGLAVSLDENRLPPRPNAGGFTLQSVLGSGGMGVVYVAQQHKPRRTVAMKVIRGASATAALLRRFEHEGELLARLQHPGIAQVYETGVADFGRGPQPYIAMELVSGQNLLEFARTRKPSMREKLDLVARLCDAVHHAHQRGVIHRDLKPANILVVEDDAASGSHSGVRGDSASMPRSSGDSLPRPKILDFGVARATDAELTVSMQTSAGQMVGTLPYMSPEQVAADPDAVDTRSDVYALGVILYQLLADRLPHDFSGKSIAEAARIIRDVEPPRLGAIDGALRGDIETIVSKAMDKDKERRYASASELAADLRRHLADQPIIARPATTLYAMRKFATRNKAVVGAAAVLAIALAGAMYMINHARVEAGVERDLALLAKQEAERARENQTRQRGEAEKQAHLSQLAVEFMSNDLLAQASPRLQPDRDITLRAALDRAAGVVHERFAGEPEAEAYIEYMLGATYESLGERAMGEQHLRRAHELRLASLGEADPQTINAALHLSSTILRQGRYDEAEALLQRTIAASERERGGNDESTLRARRQLASQYTMQGRFADAQPIYEAVIAGLTTAHGTDVDRDVVSAITGLANVHQQTGRFDLAQPLMLRAIEINRELFGPGDHRTVRAMGDYAMNFRIQRKLDEALEWATRAHNAASETLGPAHEETLAAANALALAYADLNRLPDAEKVLRSAVDAVVASRGEEHIDTANMLNSLAGCLGRMGRADEAAPLLERALKTQEHLIGESHVDTLFTMDLLAQNYADISRLDDAIALERRSLDIQRRVLQPAHPLTLMTLNNLGGFLLESGEQSQAEEVLAESVRLHKANRPAVFQGTARALVQYAECIALLKRFEEAEKNFLEAHEMFQQLGDPGAARVAGDLAMLYQATGDQEKAEAWKAKIAKP